MKIDKHSPKVSIPSLRVYLPEELEDFNTKIQRFYKDRTLTTGETVKILDRDELAVAYGAFVKRDGSNGNVYYLISKYDKDPSRYVQFENLMDQLDFWKRGKDWKQEAAMRHQTEGYEQLSMEIDVQDEVF